jgi:hypothetical protein
VKNLRAKLKKLSEPLPNMTLESFIDFCYGMRVSEVVHIRVRSTGAESDFAKLALASGV